MSNTSVQEETLKLKQTPVDLWNIREQLALAKSVLKSGSQVSRLSNLKLATY